MRFIPDLSKIFLHPPPPEPFQESPAKAEFAFAISCRSANRQMDSMYAGVKSISSMCAFRPCGVDPALTSSSITFMMAGVADPPNFALNLTPFQFQGL